MKTVLNKVLRFLNLSDRAGNLSITNIAVIVVITKIALAPTFTITECAALLVTLLNYGHKRIQSAKAEQVVKVDLSNVESAIQSIQSQVDTLTTNKDVLEKRLTEAEEKTSKYALAHALKKA